MRKSLTASLALLLALAAVTTAEAASRNTVRATAQLKLYDGPGTRYDIIGILPADTPFHLETCTYRHRWCLVLGAGGEQLGWASGSYLVGQAAKIEVTRDTDFTRHFLDPLPFRHNWPFHDD